MTCRIPRVYLGYTCVTPGRFTWGRSGIFLEPEVDLGKTWGFIGVAHTPGSVVDLGFTWVDLGYTQHLPRVYLGYIQGLPVVDPGFTWG